MKQPYGTGVKQDRPNEKEIYGTWIAGYEKQDLAKVMSVYDAGVVYQEPCFPAKNFEALAEWFKFDFARSGPRPTWQYTTESIDVSGVLAVIVTRWAGFTDAGTNKVAQVRSLRCIDFLRLGPDGWKIFRTLNDPEPCQSHPRKRPAKRKARKPK